MSEKPWIIDLLPCPFCGSEAGMATGGRYVVAHCTNDECAATTKAAEWEKEAVNVWNRRIDQKSTSSL